MPGARRAAAAPAREIRIFLALMLAMALAFLCTPRPAHAQSSNSLAGHPRLGLYGNANGAGFPFVRADQSLNSALLDSVARYDTVVLPSSPFTEYDSAVMAGLRARHPGIKIYAYVQADYAYPTTFADSLVQIPSRHYRLVRDLGAFLYDRQGQLFGDADINLARHDASGKYYVAETLADFFASAVWQTGLWDGIFIDRFCSGIDWQQTPAESIDVGRAGFANAAAFDTAWTAGSNALAARLRLDIGNAAVIVGNCGQSNQYAWMNGWMHEDFPNQNGLSWNSNMFRNPGGYTADEANFLAPQSNWLVAWPMDLTQPYSAECARRVRLTLGTASLLDGFATINPSNLDPSTNYLDWWYDEYAVDRTTGRSSGLRANTGWLGAALGPYTSLPTLGPVDAAGLNPGFETNLLGWSLATTAGATLTRDPSNAAVGLASAHVTLPSAGNGTASTRLTTTGYISLWTSNAYRISFWMRAAAPRQVVVAAVNAFNGTDVWATTVFPTTSWAHYDLDFTAPPGNAVTELQFVLGGVAVDTWIDDAHLSESDITLYRRDFENGIVLVNPTATPLTVLLDHPYRRILGNVDRVTNDGSQSTQATVPPQDALFLLATTGLVDAGKAAPGVGLAAAWRTFAPNPLPRGTVATARIALPYAGPLTVDVFDTRGRRVRGLGMRLGLAGENALTWDGAGDSGARLPRGLYFLRAGFAGATVTRKVVLE